MDDAIVKFSGIFTLQDTEINKTYPIPVQVLYARDHHIIVIYEFKDTVQPPWIGAIITGVVSHFDLPKDTTVAIGFGCPILAPNEKEPPGTHIHEISFRWVGEQAEILKTEVYINDSSSSS